MEREQLVGAGVGDQRRRGRETCICGCAGGVGQRPCCRGAAGIGVGNADSKLCRWWGGSRCGAGCAEVSVVFGLAVSGGDLYAGGKFTTAGGSAANYIAKWDGSSWSALGSGIGGSVSA